MKKNEFIEEVKDLSRCAIQNSNNFLKLIDRDVSIDWNYDFESFDKNALGVYEHDRCVRRSPSHHSPRNSCPKPCGRP